MILMNSEEYNYHPGLFLRDLALVYYADLSRIKFDEYIVVINDTAISSSEAEEWILRDNDRIFLVPKLDGG